MSETNRVRTVDQAFSTEQNKLIFQDLSKKLRESIHNLIADTIELSLTVIPDSDFTAQLNATVGMPTMAIYAAMHHLCELLRHTPDGRDATPELLYLVLARGADGGVNFVEGLALARRDAAQLGLGGGS